MIVYAYDDAQGLEELKASLKGILGDKLIFKGFCDAEKLIAAAQREKYDIAFVNVEMNNRSGMLLFGKLKARFPMRGFIGLSNTEMNSDCFTLIRYHATDYLIKPVDIDILTESVANFRKTAC